MGNLFGSLPEIPEEPQRNYCTNNFISFSSTNTLSYERQIITSRRECPSPRSRSTLEDPRRTYPGNIFGYESQTIRPTLAPRRRLTEKPVPRAIPLNRSTESRRRECLSPTSERLIPRSRLTPEVLRRAYPTTKIFAYNENLKINSNISRQINKIQQRKTESRNKLSTITTIRSSSISFIIDSIYSETKLLNWENKNYDLQSVYFINLNPFDIEYLQIKSLFSKTAKKFEISHIERIQNPYLLAAFLLKKEEMTISFGYQKVEQLFHGTKREHIMSICTGNFDWRLYGKNEGNKFGQGVSFTPYSNYATFYADEGSGARVMLLVNVLIGTECLGSKHMTLPPSGYDTTKKENGEVIVKYEDNQFYPAYKITYYCTNHKELLRRKSIKNSQNKRKQRKNNHLHYLKD